MCDNKNGRKKEKERRFFIEKLFNFIKSEKIKTQNHHLSNKYFFVRNFQPTNNLNIEYLLKKHSIVFRFISFSLK